MKFRKKPVVIEAEQLKAPVDIETLEGTMHGDVGDWLITGVNGEKYPCKPDIFAKTYAPADAPSESEAEAARYRAALEEVLEQIGTSGGFPPDLTIKAIENIANRALHPEEEG